MSALVCDTALSSCLWCGSTENLQRCGQCHRVCYCCKEHQILHWSDHKKNCTKKVPSSKDAQRSFPNRCVPEQLQSNECIPNVRQPFVFLEEPKIGISLPIQKTQDVSAAMPVWCDTTTTACFRPTEVENRQFHNDHATFSNFSNGVNGMRNTSNVAGDSISFASIAGMSSVEDDPFTQYASRGVNDINIGNLSFGNGLNSTPGSNTQSSSESRVETNQFLNEMGLSMQPTRHTDVLMQVDRGIPEFNTQSSLRHQTLCEHIIKDMNRYGICVIDNFLGPQHGEAILHEVNAMYKSGGFQEGKLVSKRGKNVSQAIRTDLITWVNGTEPNCRTVGYLIQTLDSIITRCNKTKNNGDLGQYNISTRTKAMIACYPGNNTHYVKHVDNPDQDGRCITSIYYLNKGWNEEHHGGLLRMFPTGLNQQVANIAPLFDRILLFWSDRRNPHEVQPAKSIRFAITVWYFDADERNRALMRVQDQQNQQKHLQDKMKNLFPYSN